MGASSTYREPGTTDRDYWQRQLDDAGRLPRRMILDCATLRTSGEWQSVFYAAVQEGEQVWAFVVLQHRSRSTDWNFTYKDMDETVGPFESECPARILDLLTPTDSEWANEWRERCREHAAGKASRPTVRKGDVVRFATPLQFTNGDELAELRFLERSTFVHPDCGYRYRIPRWRERQYELV